MTEEKKSGGARANLLKAKQAAKVVFEFTQICAAIVSLGATIIAAIGSDLLMSWIGSALLSQYLTILVIILSAGIGLGIVFYLAANLYQRQMRKRRLLLVNLLQREKEFFQIIEADITTLLEERGR